MQRNWNKDEHGFTALSDGEEFVLVILRVQKYVKSQKCHFVVSVQRQFFVLRAQLALIVCVVLHTDTIPPHNIRFCLLYNASVQSAWAHECKLHFTVHWQYFSLLRKISEYITFPGIVCNEVTYLHTELFILVAGLLRLQLAVLWRFLEQILKYLHARVLGE